MPSPKQVQNLVHIGCLIPSSAVAETLIFLRQRKAYNVEVQAYEPTSSNDDRDNATRGLLQQDWIVKHVTGKVTLKELTPKWVAAGFNHTTIYAALGRAVQRKIIRKLSTGTYTKGTKHNG